MEKVYAVVKIERTQKDVLEKPIETRKIVAVRLNEEEAKTKCFSLAQRADPHDYNREVGDLGVAFTKVDNEARLNVIIYCVKECSLLMAVE